MSLTDHEWREKQKRKELLFQFSVIAFVVVIVTIVISVTLIIEWILKDGVRYAIFIGSIFVIAGICYHVSEWRKRRK